MQIESLFRSCLSADFPVFCHWRVLDQGWNQYLFHKYSLCFIWNWEKDFELYSEITYIQQTCVWFNLLLIPIESCCQLMIILVQLLRMLWYESVCLWGLWISLCWVMQCATGIFWLPQPSYTFRACLEPPAIRSWRKGTITTCADVWMYAIKV